MRDRKSDTAHRKVLEAKLGRKLLPTEVADHLNEDKADNTPANLAAKGRGAHTTQHNKGRGLSKLRRALTAYRDGKKVY